MILWDQWEMFRRFLVLERKYGSWNCHTVIIFWHSPPFEELLRFILVRKIVCVRKDKLERKVGIWEDKSTGQKGGVTHLQHNALRWIEITEIVTFYQYLQLRNWNPHLVSPALHEQDWTTLDLEKKTNVSELDPLTSGERISLFFYSVAYKHFAY